MAWAALVARFTHDLMDLCGIGHHRWQAGAEIGADLNPHGQADPDKLESFFDYGESCRTARCCS
jgi:hypothetical protein